MKRQANHRCHRSRNRLRAFTLVELLTVVAIIAVLIAMLLPALKHARYTARLVVCSSQLHQITVGMINYASDNCGWYPVAENPRTWFNLLAVNRSRVDNIRPLIEPYLASPDLELMICPLVAELFPNGVGNESLVSYNIYPNSFGRGVVTSIDGGAYQVTLDRVDHSRIKRKVGQTFYVKQRGGESKSDPQFNLIASDICQSWGFGPVSGMVLNHYPPGGDVCEAHGYTNTEAWVSPTRSGSANFAREDGSVKTHNDISYATRGSKLVRDRFPRAEIQ
jgi:prepilin-type N-terminal cleavage/methylation domain-containing protein